MKKWDVLIIGSGISSLTCAALLAKKGKSVCVLEAHRKPGGYLHCFNRFGARFETGAHYVGAMGEGQPFRALLRYLGVFDESLFVPLRADGFDVFNFPGHQISFPCGYEALVRELSAQFPGERDAIESYFALVRKVVKHFPTYEFSDVASDTEIPRGALDASLATVVEGLTRDPLLKCLFYSYCIHHGVEPKDVPFGFHAIVTDSLVRGAYGLGEGGDALARKFVERIEASGGEVRTGQRVVKITLKDKMVDEVVTDRGEVYRAEWVISGIHPKAVFSLLSDPSALTPAFKMRLSGIQESMGVFGVYAACSSDVPLDPLRNYYYFNSRDPERFLESADPALPSAVFASSATRISREKQETVPVSFHAASPIEWFAAWRATSFGARPHEYKLLKEQLSEGILELAERYQPGLRATVKRYASSTPLTNLHFNGSAEGSSYGIYHSMQNTGARALGPRTHIANLLLTGQSCLFPGLLGSSVAALRTSGHLIGIKPMLGELKKELS